jgi:hypothetical protein
MGRDLYVSHIDERGPESVVFTASAADVIDIINSLSV